MSSNTVQAEHPTVLRSSYQRLRALLTISTITIAGLAVAVMVLALNNAGSTTASRATPTASPGAPPVPRAVTGNRTPAVPAYQRDWASWRAGERNASQLTSRSPATGVYQPDWTAQRAGERTSG